MNRPGERTLRLMTSPIAKFLADAATTEIVVNRPGEVGVERRGLWTWHAVPEFDYARLDGIATLAAAMMKQDVGPDKPLCGSFMPDGERIQICRPPVTSGGVISLTIRKPPGIAPSLDMLAGHGLFNATEVSHQHAHPLDNELISLHRNKDWLRFFHLAVQARKNIIICGATGSGKTTIARALLQSIALDDRLLTIEDAPEFGALPHRNVVNLFYSKGDQGSARVRAEDLIEASLRMRPDRLILQELRDGAAYSYIRGVASGHPGSVTTVHSETPEGAFDVLRLMIKQHDAGKHIGDADVLTLLRQHVDVIAHCAKSPYRITQVYFDPAAKLNAASRVVQQPYPLAAE